MYLTLLRLTMNINVLIILSHALCLGKLVESTYLTSLCLGMNINVPINVSSALRLYVYVYQSPCLSTFSRINGMYYISTHHVVMSRNKLDMHIANIIHIIIVEFV